MVFNFDVVDDSDSGRLPYAAANIYSNGIYKSTTFADSSGNISGYSADLDLGDGFIILTYPGYNDYVLFNSDIAGETDVPMVQTSAASAAIAKLPTQQTVAAAKPKITTVAIAAVKSQPVKFGILLAIVIAAVIFRKQIFSLLK